MEQQWLRAMNGKRQACGECGCHTTHNGCGNCGSLWLVPVEGAGSLNRTAGQAIRAPFGMRPPLR